MEKELHSLTKTRLTFLESVKDWQTAIEQAAKPLLLGKFIEERYILTMIDNVVHFGTYMILVPKVAMPHARPEAGALKAGFSILKLEKPVLFNKTQEVQLIICLATTDNDVHLEMLQKISTLIDEEEKVDALLNTTSKEEFIHLSNRFINEEEELG